MAKAAKAKPRSLSTFMLDKKRERCKICSLPASVLAELRAARERRIPQAVQLAWLKEEYGVTVTTTDMASHMGGRHDSE